MASDGFRSDPVGDVAAPPYTRDKYKFGADMTFNGNMRKSPGRYYLEEFFSQTPGLNADLASTTEATRVPRNKHFELLGTNAASSLATFNATVAGLTLTTAGADNDQTILLPHLDTKQTAWTGVLWGTENQVIWECAIRTGASIATILIWAGLKLTNTPTVATDDDQVLFRFSTDDADTNIEIVDSVGGVDTTTDSEVTLAINTTYKLRIEINSDRKATFYINDVEKYKSGALTNDVDLIPYIGVQSLAGAADDITVCYEKISRILFE